jgi:hypothetical protein
MGRFIQGQMENFSVSGRFPTVTEPSQLPNVTRDLWISESLGRHFSPLFWFPLTFFLGLRLAMIQRFILKAQRVAVLGGG